MQAIRTRYHGPSNTRGSYISAKCEAGSIRMPYAHELDIAGNHEAACKMLIKKMKWDTGHYADMVGGEFAEDHYWVFDDNRLKALKGIVNSMRAGTWHGSPWGYSEFKYGVSVVGRSYGYHGDPLNAPTRDDEASA